MSAGGFIPIVTDGIVFQLDPNNLLGQYKNIANPTELTTPVNGQSIVSGVYVLDGVNDSITFDKDQFIVGSVDHSFEFWYSWDSGHGSGQANLFVYGKAAANYRPKCLFIGLSTSGGKLIATVHDDPNDGNVGTSTSLNANIPERPSGGADSSFEDVFHHYVVVYDSASNLLLAYLDGVLLDSIACTHGFSSDVGTNGAGRLRIGSGSNGSTGNNQGKLSLINIYKNKALDATEVLKNYEATKHRFQ